MRKIYVGLCLLLCAASMFAVPAKRVKKTITLADGTTCVATLMGDESMHFMQSEDGRVFRENEKGLFEEDNASLVKAEWQEKTTKRNAARRVTWGATQQNITGEKKGLVILVSFSDKAIVNTQQEFSNFFNQVGYSKNNMGGSVRDYFLSQSYGQLTIDFDVVGPVKVSKSYSYYGANDSGGSDKYAATMVIEALKLVDSQVNFADYDWDGDGKVDQVYVIYAGYGEASGAPANTIWPHEYELSSAKLYGDGSGAQKMDGVTIDTYACSSELNGTSGSTMDGVGTACHEFSHCLGIPDMYDSNGSNFGMGSWDLMDYGCYGGDGYCPCGYTSYERMYSGWMKPTVLSSYTEVKNMPAITSEGQAYIIYNQAYKNEYYMLENRQQTGWDKYLPGHGLLVLHVDFDSDVWINNTVNDVSSRQRMTIIPADNSLNSNYDSQMAGDPFPGTKNKTELTNTSTPAAKLYNANSDGKKFLNFPIRSISENTTTKTVSFVAGERTIDAPVAYDATNITLESFRANWSTVNDADSYEVQLTVRDTTTAEPADAVLLSEDFSKFSAGVSGTIDLGSKLDSYMSNPGWTGSLVYTSYANGAKLGSSGSAGYLVSPTITAPTTGKATIAVTCIKYAADSGTIDVSANDKAVGSFTPSPAATTSYVTVDMLEDFKIKIATSEKRCYVSGVTVYDGAFTEAELAKAPRKVTTTSVYYTSDSFYDFVALSPNCTYSYKVRSVADSVTSAWSNSINVSLSENTAVRGVEAEPASPYNGKVYDLSGRIVRNPSKGIFIINGKKVVK